MALTSQYLNLANEIKGTSRDPSHPGWIELTSATIGVGQRIGTSSGRVGNSTEVRYPPILVTKSTDFATADLMQAVFSGRSFSWAIIDMPRANAYWTLADVMLGQFQASSDTDLPRESFSLHFGAAAYNSGKAPARLASPEDIVAGMAQLALAMLGKHTRP